MSGLEFDLRITDPAWQVIAGVEGLCGRALQAGQAVCNRAGGRVEILLTGDDMMQRLNRDWRGKDAPTDVLSFPAGEMAAGFLGDLALGHGVCSRDATALGRDLPDHISHLVIHGLLHLHGYDHMEDTQAEQMQALEREALAILGLADPYLENNRAIS
jgi:probable rRNA maturation factor